MQLRHDLPTNDDKNEPPTVGKFYIGYIAACPQKQPAIIQAQYAQLLSRHPREGVHLSERGHSAQ